MQRDACYLLDQTPKQGGGNVRANPRIIVRRTGAIGDAIAATVVCNKLQEKGYECEYQTSPNIHAILRLVPNIGSLAAPAGYVHCDLDRAYELDPNRKVLHFTDIFLSKASLLLAPYGITLGNHNARPVVVVPAELREISRARFNDYPRPWIFICPKSHTYRPRQVPDRIWEAAAKDMPGTKFWLGLSPSVPGIVDLNCRNLENLVAWLSVADLLVSVDTGPAHVGIAMGVPSILLGQSSSPELHFSDQRDFETIWPEGDLKCLNCQLNICPVNNYLPPCQIFEPEKIAQTVKRKLGTEVSALIPTYRADERRLDKCVSNVVDQVDEVVITAAADAMLPNIPNHPKVRVVRSPRSNLGFGKNVNFGMRHTSGKWVLLLNDDCYLNGDCVEQLKTLRAPEVGMIAHLLRYPDSRIYFAGRRRNNGDRGCPHIDHGKYLPTITTVEEMEAVSGTSVLINRKAYYNIGGFDERFHLYAEDDCISLAMRQAGHRLLYHPTALGIHEGSATAKQTHNIAAEIKKSGALMEQLWGWYYDRNKGRVPGVFK